MSFVADDFQALIRLLEQHPEWRAELRRHVLSDELLQLPDLVRQLAQGQSRTDDRLAVLTERVDALAAQMAVLTERVDGLAAQMAALTERVDGLAAQIVVLAEHMDALARGHRNLAQEVGALSELVGARAEVDAERALVEALREKGYELVGPPGPVDMDGELDVAVQVKDASGRPFWALVEGKARLRRGDVQGWDRRLRDPGFLARLERQGLAAPYLVYVFGLRVYRDAREEALDRGIGVLGVQGEQVAPRPRPNQE